jgi:hypothetical protein
MRFAMGTERASWLIPGALKKIAITMTVTAPAGILIQKQLEFS